MNEDRVNSTAEAKRQLLAKLLAEKSRAATTPSANSAPADTFHPGLVIPEYFRARERWLAGLDIRSPFFQPIDGMPEPDCFSQGQVQVNFSSYNYLGLASDPRVMTAAQEAIAQYGTTVSASRLASGERVLHAELEQRLAALVGTEDALVFVSGFGTNESVISHLMGPGDLIIHDRLIHSSILHGALASGATLQEFHHGNSQALEGILERERQHFNQCLIAVEGLYSMDGDICDLPELLQLKRDYRAALLVDEAHSIGVLGASGRGISEHWGVKGDEVDLWMGTLSKSLASCGGYIAASSEMINYLKYTVPGFVYSVGMTPASTASAVYAVDIMQQEPQRVASLRDNATYFLNGALERGLDTGIEQAFSVVPVFVRDLDLAVRLSSALMEAGINVQPAIAPAVPEGSERLRFFITVLHSREQMDRALDLTVETMARLGV